MSNLIYTGYGQIKGNAYDLSGEYGIGYTSKDEPYYFYLEDFDKIKDYTWRINQGYIVTNVGQGGKKQLKMCMHRYLLEVTDPQILVDHINHSKADNRRTNLRLVTNQQNHLTSRANTSGVTGVYYNKNRNQWQAGIYYNRKNIYLGIYDNKEDAIKARKEAEIKYFGEYQYKE